MIGEKHLARARLPEYIAALPANSMWRGKFPPTPGVVVDEDHATVAGTLECLSVSEPSQLVAGPDALGNLSTGLFAWRV